MLVSGQANNGRAAFQGVHLFSQRTVDALKQQVQSMLNFAVVLHAVELILKHVHGALRVVDGFIISLQAPLTNFV